MKLIAPQFVKPFLWTPTSRAFAQGDVKTNKNDAADAKARRGGSSAE